MDEKLVNQLRLLKKYIRILGKIRETDESEYLKDIIIQGAAERYLQLAIESCINIGNRMLSLEQLNYDVDMVESYTDIFKNLSRIGIIKDDFIESLMNMARVRNRLVHVYWDLDNKYIYRILHENISDLDKFCAVAADYINNQRDR